MVPSAMRSSIRTRSNPRQAEWPESVETADPPSVGSVGFLRKNRLTAARGFRYGSLRSPLKTGEVIRPGEPHRTAESSARVGAFYATSVRRLDPQERVFPPTLPPCGNGCRV